MNIRRKLPYRALSSSSCRGPFVPKDSPTDGVPLSSNSFDPKKQPHGWGANEAPIVLTQKNSPKDGVPTKLK